MGKRISDIYKKQKQALHYDRMRRREEQGIPLVRSLCGLSCNELKDSGIDIKQDGIVCITNLLDNTGGEALMETKIHSIGGMKGRRIVNSIICPICNNVVQRNPNWNCFICQDESHSKIILDIKNIKIPELVKEQ